MKSLTMANLLPVSLLALAMTVGVNVGVAADSIPHDHSTNPHHGATKAKQNPMHHNSVASPKASLLPPEGASVKIVSPKNGQTFKGDQVPIEFKLVKGKKAEHVHAYIDGELMGMFKGDNGTLTGIKPGAHILELRAATGDHKAELDATDRVKFTVQ
jgi:hypothetical protein